VIKGRKLTKFCAKKAGNLTWEGHLQELVNFGGSRKRGSSTRAKPCTPTLKMPIEGAKTGGKGKTLEGEKEGS